MTETAIINLALRPAVVIGIVLGFTEFADLGPYQTSEWVTWAPAVLGLVYLIFAAAREAGRRTLRRQAAGFALFSAVTLVALMVEPRVGQFVVAAGWFGHAAWDYAHRDGSVVPRWYVDFCIPYDLLVGGSLLAAAVLR
jgi:hypothetical protein